MFDGTDVDSCLIFAMDTEGALNLALREALYHFGPHILVGIFWSQSICKISQAQ